MNSVSVIGPGPIGASGQHSGGDLSPLLFYFSTLSPRNL